MASNRFWLNRIGKFAPTSNPYSNVPNYGLTLDVATAPWDDETQFDALVAEQVASQLINGLAGLGQRVVQPVQFQASRGEDGNVLDDAWSAANRGLGFLGDQMSGAIGALDTAADKLGADITAGNRYDKIAAEADAQGLTGWDRLQFIGKADFGETMKAVSEDPIASKVFWALDQASEGVATAFVTGTLSDNNPLKMLDGTTWAAAHGVVKQYDLNAGEGFVQMFYDKELLNDEDRFREIRKNSGAFNFGALGFNAIAAWKYAPEVLAAKGAGRVRDMRRGKLAKDSPAAFAVQRDILAQPTREAAEAAARAQTGLADRVRANRALTLWDKAQNLRAAARRAADPLDPSFGYEDFKRLSPFVNSASGTVLSKLLMDVSTDDDAWNLTFRAAIGDSSAIPEIQAMRPEIADKIEAIELGPLRSAQAEFDDISARYEARLHEQGGKMTEGDRLILTSQRDWFLDQDFETAKVRLEETKARLSAYTAHESWLQRTARGVDDGRQTDPIFNTLDYLNPKKAGREALGDRFDNSLYRLGGRVSTWAHDEFSPATRFITAPRKPMLKRVGVVNLHDVEEGAQGIASYLDQFAYMAGRQDQRMRDAVLARWAGSGTDVDRRKIVDELEGQGIALVLRKHGIKDAETVSFVRTLIQGKRADAWSRMSDQARYTTVTDEAGRRLDKRVFEYEDADGSLTKVAMPMDPTELPNWRPLTNLTDLDHEIARHADLIKEFARTGAREVKGSKAGQARRFGEDAYVHFGEALNSLWKPMALISIRWPARVVMDESFRVMLMLGPMAHFGAGAQGAMNILHNTGFTKPFEWVRGRKVKVTSGLAEDSTRAFTGSFDPADYRQNINPNAAVPVGALDLDSLDEVRQARLMEQTAERRAWVRKGQMGEKPKWAQKFDDRIAAAESATSRGFFFDPITGRAKNKGFAVSVYPGRMRSFDKKPSSAELHWFLEKNGDILSSKNNQVATWLDKDTGRWHLDVVQVSRRREDALTLAARADATEFFDIEDGFTRYMRDEDPFEHAQYAARGPEVAPEGDTPGPVSEAFLDRDGKRKIGFGVRRYKTSDGRTVEWEDVYGASFEDRNIFYDTHSAKPMAQRLYGGYTKGLGVARARRSGNSAVSIDPADHPDAWRRAQSEYVNKHFRNSPIWKRMLAGQSDEKVLNWLTGTPEGRALRTRMPERGQNPARWVADMRAIFDHTLPTPQARLAARERDIDPKEWDDLIPADLRNDVHGDTILMAGGLHDAQRMWRAAVDKVMTALGAMPTDQLVRHPFARNLYNMRMRNHIASLDADEITPEVMNAAAASARAFATKQVRRLLYNIADENQAIHMFRFVAPFFQAQMEVLERYAHLFTSQPEAMVRFAQFYYLSQQGNEDRGLWYMVDADGNPTSRMSHDNKMVIQKTPVVEYLMNKIPGLKNGGELAVPVASLDLVFQGEKPYLPSMGPLVTVPASEFYYKDRPWKSEGEVFKWLFPFGTPVGSNAPTRAFNAMAPAWGKRLYTALQNDFNDSAYANFTNIRYQDLVFAWEQEHGKRLPQRLVPKFIKQAESETKAYWFLRAASSFVMPFPVEQRSPQQFWIDEARKYRNKYGLDADKKFYDDFGSDYFKFFTESTRSTNGLAPTASAAQGYNRYKKLADMAPDLAGIIAGPGSGADEFNHEVYRWQLRTRKGPGSKENMRELQDPEERIREGQENQGWIEYSKLAAAVDAEMRARGLTSLNSNAASDLRQFKAIKVREIIERNPAWQTAYRSRNDTLSNWLNQANTVVFEPAFDGRTDMQGLRDYMVSREKVQEYLAYRLANGGSASLSASDNADLAEAWNSYLTELTSKNLLFAEIYHRYLESDDLTVMVND